MNKKYIYLIIFLLLGTILYGVFWANSNKNADGLEVLLKPIFEETSVLLSAVEPFKEKTKEYRQNPKGLIMKTTATSTYSLGAARFTHSFDSEWTNQGTCIRIKDSDGVGYTYLIVNNGVANFSMTSCE